MGTKELTNNKNENNAVVLTVNLNQDENFENQCQETVLLAQAAGFNVKSVLQATRQKPHPKTFIGSGKLQELKSCIAFHKANNVIVNHTLSDGQYSRLNNELDSSLLDYSGLILNIFAERATTATGKLQVELAQEIYGRSKLKGAWTHLERQRAAHSITGGPGERQLELDRRMIAKRIAQLRKKLKKCSKHVQLTTTKRATSAFTVALVGYTNAGKSTLFEQLTKTNVSASKRLFETLSTTSRQLHLDTKLPANATVLSDTVGFIRNLPHELIEAFHSTLHEAVTADLLLVVIDATDPQVEAKLDTINDTLTGIGAGDIPYLLVCNKTDLGKNRINGSYRKHYGKMIDEIEISALNGTGIDMLRAAIYDTYKKNHLKYSS